MAEKLAAVILDALDMWNIRQYDMHAVEDLYNRRNSEVLGCSTAPHTAVSNPMIWAGEPNNDKIWEKRSTRRWTGPFTEFERDHDRIVGSQGIDRWQREDFEKAFIWDVLDHRGFDASAIQVPFVLPPYSYNTLEGYEMGEAWFPDTQERMRRHAREVPEAVLEHARAGRDFIAASVQFPDKWQHGLPEGKCSREFVDREGPAFARTVKEMVGELEELGYDWLLFGDHGSPWPGFTLMHGVRMYLHRHRKESIIIGSMEDQLPRYTGEIYPFLLDYFEAEDAGFGEVETSGGGSADVDSGEVKRRLENLGYS